MTAPTATGQRNPRRVVGLGLLALVAGGLLAWQLTTDPTLVSGPVGGEKIELMRDPDVLEILRDGFDLELDVRSEGSLEMVASGNLDGSDDFLWPGSEVSLVQYEQEQGPVEDANVFNSPIVLYSWDGVTDALIERGLVRDGGGVLYVDMPALVTEITDGTQWSDLGLELFGGVSVQTTDPTRSNSGSQFAALLAATLNDGQVVNEQTVDAVLPHVRDVYGRLGFLENTSGDLFSKFLQQGEGAFPLIAGYESQVIEFGLANDQYRDLIADRVRILYPEPTVWSSHPLIPTTPGGEQLRDALLSDEIQRIAWERHGFRSGTVTGQVDPGALAADFVGVPATIDRVLPMPAPAVMARLIAAFGSGS